MSAPSLPRTAVLLIDVINDMEFPESQRLLNRAIPVARGLAAFCRRMRRRKVPIVYVNDNFGRWQTDFNSQIERCIGPESPGREVARLLLPQPQDYFVLKPMHSGFYSTSLEVLLAFLGVDTLIITGFAADICVLYTANDAYMRNYHVIVPSDGVAAETIQAEQTTLNHIRHRLKGRVCKLASIG